MLLYLELFVSHNWKATMGTLTITELDTSGDKFTGLI
jgi:hypothetical protein